MSQERKASGEQPDGPGEAVIDEPTAHALDAEPDPNNDWERSAAEQTAPETSGNEDSGPPDPDDTGDSGGDGDDQVDAETDVAEEHDAG